MSLAGLYYKIKNEKIREDVGDSQTFRETIMKVANIVGRHARSFLEDKS